MTIASSRRRTRLLLLMLVLMCPGVNATKAARSLQEPRNLTPLQLEIEKQKQRLSATEVEERRDALMRLTALHRAEASRAALPALSDLLPLIRATAAAAVVYLPADEAVARLIPLLSDKDEFVRQQTAYALGITGSRTAVAPLIERLNLDKLDSVRAAAAVALGQIRDEAAVVPLVETLSTAGTAGKKRKKEKNEFILRAAARSLGQIGSRAGSPVLIETLADKSLSSDVRREAALALGQIRDPAAVSALRAAELETDIYLAQAAGDALRRINSQPRQ